MREIKYRAWQKDKKMMCEVKNIHFASRQISMKEKENVTNTRPFEDIELMQFTGLYDKNKVPIYEGDIVRDNTLAKDVNTMIVIYENGGFFVDYSEEYKPLLAGVNHNCEVIGNVWENSDLLGE